MVKPPAFEDKQPLSSPSYPDAKRTIGVALACIWIFFGVQLSTEMVISGLIGAIEGFSYHADLSNRIVIALNNSVEIVSLFAATLASGGLAVAYGAKQLHLNPMRELNNTKFDKSWLLKGVTMSYAVSFVLGLLVNLINWIGAGFGLQIPETTIPQSSNLLLNVVNFLAVVIAAPILEETLFRGIICKGLARYNKGFAVVFSALLFAMAHLNLDQGIPVFGMGLVFAYVYMRSGSLLVPIFMHIVNNFIAMLVSYGIGDFLTILASLAILVLAIIGAVFLIQERHEIGGMFRQCSAAKDEWRLAAHMPSFWLIVVLFLGFSLLFIVFNFLQLTLAGL